MIWWLHLISDKLQILTYARHLWSLKSWYFWLATQTVALVCFKVIHVFGNDDESIFSSGTFNNMVVNLCLLQARYIMSTYKMIMLATFIFANREHHYHINMHIKLIACLHNYLACWNIIVAFWNPLSYTRTYEIEVCLNEWIIR